MSIWDKGLAITPSMLEIKASDERAGEGAAYFPALIMRRLKRPNGPHAKDRYCAALAGCNGASAR
jgi:hypothetical protein